MWVVSITSSSPMNAKALLPALFLLVVSLPLCANDGHTFEFIKTNSGKVYTHCRIFKTDPDGVIISHQHGGAKVLFSDLAPDARVMLGYDAKKEAAYEKDRAEAKRNEREELWKYRREVAKAQAAAYAAESKRLDVIALQSTAMPYGYASTYLPGYGWWDGGYGFGYGIGYGNGYGRNGHGWPCATPFGFSKGRYSLPTPANFGTLNVRGRTFFAPGVCAPRTTLATPAMGPLTPGLGTGAR